MRVKVDFGFFSIGFKISTICDFLKSALLWFSKILISLFGCLCNVFINNCICSKYSVRSQSDVSLKN